MPYSLVDYRGLQVISPDPEGDGALAFQENLKKLADRSGPVHVAATDPGANDDVANTGGHGKFYRWSMWLNTSSAAIFVCTDASTGAAVWVRLGPTGSAATLTTARNINGVPFDGSANITVSAAASTLTGETLASGVTSSSLTSFGESPVLAGTPTAPTASGGTNTMQIATTAFVASAVAAAVTGAFVFQTTIDASASPNYPAASKGWLYIISVAGKIGGGAGMSVDVGDAVVAIADNAGGTQAAVGASWDILEHNLVGALLAANNLGDVGDAATARANIGAVGTTDSRLSNSRTPTGHAGSHAPMGSDPLTISKSQVTGLTGEDNSATPNTLVLRDNAGGFYGGAIVAGGLINAYIGLAVATDKLTIDTEGRVVADEWGGSEAVKLANWYVRYSSGGDLSAVYPVINSPTPFGAALPIPLGMIDINLPSIESFPGKIPSTVESLAAASLSTMPDFSLATSLRSLTSSTPFVGNTTLNLSACSGFVGPGDLSASGTGITQVYINAAAVLGYVELSDNLIAELPSEFCLACGAGSVVEAYVAYFNFSGNALSESAVNALLIAIRDAQLAPGAWETGTIDLSAGTNAPPTGDGVTAMNDLISDGWTVTTN